ncbi:MAG TPA: alpha-glucosidase C-terminal domain-containing protein, partial [Polyangia bacterium]
LLFSLPGTPVMRYGDEIGMGDDQSLPDRKSVRTPMQWTADPHGGFSRAEKTELPAIAEGPFSFRQINVAAQRLDNHSLLNLNERFIRVRKECPEFGWGQHEVLRTRSPNVLAVRCHWRGNAVLTLHNFSSEARTITLTVPEGENLPLTNLLADDHAPANPKGEHQFTLGPYEYRWFRVGPLLDVATRVPC